MGRIGKEANVKGKNKDMSDRGKLSAAKAAIDRGVDISYVHKLLKEEGIDPSALGSDGKFEPDQVEGATAIPVGKEGPDYEKLVKATKTPFTKIAIIAIAVLLVIAAGWFFRFQKLSSYRYGALIMNRWTGATYQVVLGEGVYPVPWREAHHKQ